MTIIYLALAWAIGIVLAWRIDEPSWVTLASVVGGLICLGVWIRARHRGNLLWLVLAFVAMGCLRLESVRPSVDAGHVAQWNGRDTVTLSGIVRDAPIETDTAQLLHLDVETAEWAGQEADLHGTVLIYNRSLQSIAYGDKITVRGALQLPTQGDTFSFAEKLARDNVFSIMSTNQVQIEAHKQGHPLRQELLTLRNKAKKLISESLSEPQAGLLVGILLGDESRLSPQTKQAFNQTGTSHIIAISGFNMTIIAGIMMSFSLAIFRRRGAAVAISLVILVLYTMLVGGSASVVRAAIMGGVLVVAPLVQKKTYLPASVAFAGFVMSFANPFVLWDIGFQLSFAAVVGMATLVPPLDRAFRHKLQGLVGKSAGGQLATWLSEPIVVTLVAQIATLPLMLTYFGSVSPTAIPANFLIIPIQPLVLILGGLATLIGLIFAPLGNLLFQADWIFLAYTIEVVQFFADKTTTLNAHLSPHLTLLLYGSAVVLILLNATRPRWFEAWWLNFRQGSWSTRGQRVLRYALPLMAIVVLGGMGQALVNQPNDQLHVMYLDMGHSQSVLIRTPNGAVYLMDGGRFPSRLRTAIEDALPTGQRQIDVLFLSSDATTDSGAIIDLLDTYTIKTVINAVAAPYAGDFAQLLDALEAHGATVLPSETGARIESGDGVTMTILAPSEDITNLVVRLAYKEAVFLFTSDLGRVGEEALLATPHLVQATVLQAGRHATSTTNSAEWIATVNPQVVIVQTDPASREDETSRDVLDGFDGRKIYRTDEHGRLDIATDGKNLEIRTEK